jgi:hypothetical protein
MSSPSRGSVPDPEIAFRNPVAIAVTDEALYAEDLGPLLADLSELPL